MNTLPIDDNKNKNILAGFIDEAIELPNRINSLQSYNTTILYKRAKSDIRSLVKHLSSQQIIYSIIVVFIFNGDSTLSPLLPVAISDFPFLLQFTMILYNIFSANAVSDKSKKTVMAEHFNKFQWMHQLGSTVLELLVLINIIMMKLRNNTENAVIKSIRLLIIGQYAYHMMSIIYPKVMAINKTTKTTKTKKSQKSKTK